MHLRYPVNLCLRQARVTARPNTNSSRSIATVVDLHPAAFTRTSSKHLKTRISPINFAAINPNKVLPSTFNYSDRVLFTTYSKKNIFWKDMGETQSSGLPDTSGIERKDKIKLSDEEWKAKLTPEQYSVCRNHGTERAWTGALLDNKGKGIYQCACCGADLFNSSTKFDSGSGWPSFYDTLKENGGELPAVDTHTDRTHGMVRTEVLCGRCDSHLGHVFNDGPQPTGLRYCINSVSLKFKKDSTGKSKDDL